MKDMREMGIILLSRPQSPRFITNKSSLKIREITLSFIQLGIVPRSSLSGLDPYFPRSEPRISPRGYENIFSVF